MRMTLEEFNETVELNNYYLQTFLEDIDEMNEELEEYWCPRYAAVRDQLVEAVEELMEKADDLSPMWRSCPMSILQSIQLGSVPRPDLCTEDTGYETGSTDPVPTLDYNSPPPAKPGADRYPTFYQAGMPMDSVYSRPPEQFTHGSTSSSVSRLKTHRKSLNDNLKSAKEKQQAANDMRKLAKEMDLEKMHRYNQQRMMGTARKSWADAAAQWMRDYGRF